MFIHRHLKIGLILLIIIMFGLIGDYQAQAQEDQEDKFQLGGQIFVENCAVCHGLDGEGRVGVTLAKDWPSIRPDLVTKDTIEKGVTGSPMPAWSMKNGGPLTDEEIDAVVFYILSWQTGGPAEIFPTSIPSPRSIISPVPEVEGDPNQGGILYDQNCAVCHGPNGEGRIGASLVKDWSSIRPDLTIKTTIERGVAGSPMPAWSKGNGGPLTDKAINDLVAFIMSWSAAEPIGEPTPIIETESWLTGWGGIFVFFLLFLLVVSLILLVQRRR